MAGPLRGGRAGASPRQTPAALEAQVLALRDAHPRWGGLKLHDRLVAQGVAAVPAPSPITASLRRHGRRDPAQTPTPTPTPVQRVEHPAPKEVWQLDCMGHLPIRAGRVQPVSLLDDHARLGLALVACAGEPQEVVQTHLVHACERDGLPQRILSANGPPWGTRGAGGLTALAVWLLRRGSGVSHGRPAQPQPQGTVARWQATIQAEVFRLQSPRDLAAGQQAFDRCRAGDHLERPPAAVGHATPASRDQPSRRPYPATMPPIEDGPDDRVRKVNAPGSSSGENPRHVIGRGLAGMPVAVRPTTTDGKLTVHCCYQQVATIPLQHGSEV